MSARGVRRRAAVAAGVGAGLLAGSWMALRYPTVQRLDVRLGDAVRRSGSPALDRTVTATTDLGSMYAVVGTASVLAASGRRRLATDVLGVGTLAWVVAQSGKTRVRRQRPYEADGVRRLIAPPTGSSFPSGHAAVAVAVLSVLAEHARPGAAFVVRVASAYVPVSRVYVGVHYPTDVVGGAGLGLVLSGLWRGPVAALGRRLITTSVSVAGGVAPPTVRLAVWALVGVSFRGRQPRSPGAPR